MPEFDTDTVNGIVDHMNDDHKEALQLYLEAFTDIRTDAVENIQMTGIDAHGISLSYTKDGRHNKISIAFVKTIGKSLSSVSGARGALVAMAKIARK